MHLVSLQLSVSTSAANKKKGPVIGHPSFFIEVAVVHLRRGHPASVKFCSQSQRCLLLCRAAPSSWPGPYSTSERARTSGLRTATSSTASFRNPSGKNAKEKWSRSRRPQALSPLRGFLFSKHKLLLL